jgi:hypothetical protein
MVAIRPGPQAGYFRYSYINGQNRVKITSRNHYFQKMLIKSKILFWNIFMIARDKLDL